MIDFQQLKLEQKQRYDTIIMDAPERGCEYSFSNLFLWGRQQACFMDDFVLLFSQYNRRTVYPFPVGSGDLKAMLERIMQDAKKRGIPCRLTGLTGEECVRLETLFPGKFRIHCDRDSYDYIYAIDDLADLKGRKFQKKRNHINRFRDAHPDAIARPLDENTLPAAKEMIAQWYADRLREDPQGDYHMEQAAIRKALHNLTALGMEGLVLFDGGEVIAVTMGSQMNADTFDVHFEKARADIDGAYAAINQEFARYIRDKHPQIRWLNREDDLGLEGLRKAKLSYYPDHMVEKYKALLTEDIYED
jgi:hypothetical protein